MVSWPSGSPERLNHEEQAKAGLQGIFFLPSCLACLGLTGCCFPDTSAGNLGNKGRGWAAGVGDLVSRSDIQTQGEEVSRASHGDHPSSPHGTGALAVSLVGSVIRGAWPEDRGNHTACTPRSAAQR